MYYVRLRPTQVIHERLLCFRIFGATSFRKMGSLRQRLTSPGEELDQSGLGVELKFLTSAQSIDEAENCWPGIGVAKDGYVPVGSCLYGSGDYYYIRTSDGESGPLYRIYHDAVDAHGYDPSDAIAVVLKNYQDLLHHVKRQQL
jgi:hypothetical protein